LIQEPVLETKIELRDVFVVPGNHDVRFNESDAENRFAPYIQFYNKFFKSIQPAGRSIARPEEASSLTRVHVFRDDRFLIAEINSCFYVEKETPDESRGQVDAQTIASLRRQLESVAAEAKGWIKIALLHHHPVLLPSFVEAGRGVDAVLNARSLLGLLREHGFQLILHGHKHFPQVFSYDPEPAWATTATSTAQLVIAGGSAGSKSLPEATRKCNTYNLLTVKSNPQTDETRIQIITRGLVRFDATGDLDPDRWQWETLRVYDKVLSPPLKKAPVLSPSNEVPFPKPDDKLDEPSLKKLPSLGPSKEVPSFKPSDKLEEERSAVYQKLRFNMPVVEIIPSLVPGQGYEARAWIARHNPYLANRHKESPKQVVWSAGPMFGVRKICGADAAPNFAVSFHYWGAVLIQAELTFADGEVVTGTVYARAPDSPG
jgi:3',5'-cyclic AMP phosphodiesterase CpdA